MDFIRIRIICVKLVMLSAKHALVQEPPLVLRVMQMHKNVCSIPLQISVYALMDTMMILRQPVKYVI